MLAKVKPMKDNEVIEFNGHILPVKEFMDSAFRIATRSRCIKRKVGAEILWLNKFAWCYVGSGFNRTKNKCHQNCQRAESASGRDMDKCPAIHAEIDAISRLRKLQNMEPKIKKTKNLIMVVTTHPCMECCKAIAETNISAVYYSDLYYKQEEAEKLAPKVRFVRYEIK